MALPSSYREDAEVVVSQVESLQLYQVEEEVDVDGHVVNGASQARQRHPQCTVPQSLSIVCCLLGEGLELVVAQVKRLEHRQPLR